MIEKLRSAINKLLENTRPTPVDPTKFTDPVATHTEWSALKPGGTNFCTHRLRNPTPYTYEFRATLLAIIFYSLFLAFGSFMLVIGTNKIMGRPDSVKIQKENAEWMLAGVGLAIAIFAGRMLYNGTAPIVFDRRSGIFCKGRNARAGKGRILIDQIHAIQLISEHCSGKNRGYYSYELNLVLRDGTRIQVIDHGSLELMLTDSKKLSGFLGVPVWNAI